MLLERFCRAFSQEIGVYSTRHGAEVEAPILMLRGRLLDGSDGTTKVFLRGIKLH